MAVLSDGFATEMLQFIGSHPECSSAQIHAHFRDWMSLATVKRALKEMVEEKKISVSGAARSTRYSVIRTNKLRSAIDVEEYFSKEQDHRKAFARFNFDIWHDLNTTPMFDARELAVLNEWQAEFEMKVAKQSKEIYRAEMERLAIDLSWKSSQIEGNTYSLLETEQLLRYSLTAAGKTKDHAVMLLNHKRALDFIFENQSYVWPLSVRAIEDIHSMLVDGLGVSRNLRSRTVGISGTNYRPLDNEHQIREALQETCDLVNRQTDIFSAALLTLMMLSYIQPFADGNKRTARIVSNAILIHHKYCPLSFRTVDPLDYKKAMLIFYEQNIAGPIKRIFGEQFEFAVKTYF
jgi:Fic family protein